MFVIYGGLLERVRLELKVLSIRWFTRSSQVGTECSCTWGFIRISQIGTEYSCISRFTSNESYGNERSEYMLWWFNYSNMSYRRL